MTPGARRIVGAVAAVFGLRLLAGALAAATLVDPVARALVGSPGGEAGLLTDGALRLNDLVLGEVGPRLVPGAVGASAIALALLCVEMVAVTVLFAAVHADDEPWSVVGARVFPRFVLLAGIKALVTVVIVAAMGLVLPSPRLAWTASQTGLWASILYGVALATVLGTLRIVFDVARSVSFVPGQSLGKMVSSTRRALGARAAHLALRLVAVEAVRVVLLAAVVLLGALALRARWNGGGLAGVWGAFASQEALLLVATGLDVVWIRWLRAEVVRA